MPNIACSGSYQPAPSPISSRPFEMWSTVTDILATICGKRNVLDVTRMPTRIFSVRAASPASSDQASKYGPVGRLG